MVSISGVTPGECATLGSVKVEINDFVCEAHVVPGDFPIDTDGLLGWDMLTKHEAKINAANKRLKVGRLVIPFEKEEQFAYKNNDRTTEILRELDPDKLKGLNEQEIEHIKELKMKGRIFSGPQRRS